MADIKDFIRKQTTPVNIGVPRSRNIPVQEPVSIVEQPVSAPVSSNSDITVQKNKPGRRKGDVQKVKLSLYVPEEVKDQLIRIQHDTYKSSLNDTLVEAVMRYIASQNQ